MTTKHPDLKGAADAVSYTRGSLGKTMRAAREVAGLSVERLAQLLFVTTVSVLEVESGRRNIDERYVAQWLKACGLPKDWKRPR